MRLAFTLLLVAHGCIHAMGFVKAFGLARLPLLGLKIEPPLGVPWLVASVLMLATAGALYAWPRGWWMVGGAALVASIAAILSCTAPNERSYPVEIRMHDAWLCGSRAFS